MNDEKCLTYYNINIQWAENKVNEGQRSLRIKKFFCCYICLPRGKPILSTLESSGGPASIFCQYEMKYQKNPKSNILYRGLVINQDYNQACWPTHFRCGNFVYERWDLKFKVDYEKQILEANNGNFFTLRYLFWWSLFSVLFLRENKCFNVSLYVHKYIHTRDQQWIVFFFYS